MTVIYPLYIATVICLLSSVACTAEDAAAAARSCSLYLAPSVVIPNNRGVYAGRSYNQGDIVIDGAPTLLINERYTQNWSLNNYVFATGDDLYSMALISEAIIFNHKDAYNTHHVWSEESPAPIREEHMDETKVLETITTYTAVNFIASTDITSGQEIFTSYGSVDWFTARDIPYIDGDGNSTQCSDTVPTDGAAEPSSCQHEPKADSSFLGYKNLTLLHEVGVCISDVYVGYSDEPMAGKGLFADRDFKKGDLVTISPVVLMNITDVIDASFDSVLLNYGYSCVDSDVFVYPLGSAGVINHNRMSLVNVRLQWHSHPLTSTSIDTPLQDLMNALFSPLDMAYIATKDIAANDELFLYYGDEFINEYAYFLAKKLMYNEGQDRTDGEDRAPIFRHPTMVDCSFFPKSWLGATDAEDMRNH